MTSETYYGARYRDLTETRDKLLTLAERLKNSPEPGDDLQPVVYYTSRIKSPESMMKKLESRGFPATAESALTNVYDAVGIRIVCSFASDVLHTVQKLEREPSIAVLEKKDYVLNPKPNGYRSVHLCIRMKEPNVLAEIQVRTIAMDFWATLEHQLKYKKNVRSGPLIQSELKRCADEIASTDLSMQTIREILKEM